MEITAPLTANPLSSAATRHPKKRAASLKGEKIGTTLSRIIVAQTLMQNKFQPEENEAPDTLSEVSRATLNTRTFLKMFWHQNDGI